nr:DNA polymerase III subunit delta' [Gammaproteobacteria bacterium]
MDLSRTMATLLPWHNPQWTLLADACKNQRLGHALLLRGRQGFGVPQFARRLARALVCRHPMSDKRPCGICRSCSLSNAGSHPDLMIVEPDQGKASIGIVPVRRLIDALGLAPKFGGPKVAILSPAELLTREASNSLLKTLEEPPGDAVFLLVSHSAAKVPPTVRSRCQLIDFPTPCRRQACQWLAAQMPQPADVELVLDIAGGAPIRALDMMQADHLPLRGKVLESFVDVVSGQADPLEVAKLWRVSGTNEVLQWLASMAADCIKLSCAEASSRVVNRDILPALTSLAQAIAPRRFFALWDCCIQANKDHGGSAGLNDQLLLEGVAMTCTALAHPRSSSSH